MADDDIDERQQFLQGVFGDPRDAYKWQGRDLPAGSEGLPPLPAPPPTAELKEYHRPGENNAAEDAAGEAGRALKEGRYGDVFSAAGPMVMSALLGLGAKTPMRSQMALQRAKQITAAGPGPKQTPSQVTEQAWKAGGKFGGWDQIPIRMENGKPVYDWARYVPTFTPGEPPINPAAFKDYPSAYEDKGIFGGHKTRTVEGKLGELTNLNPAVLREHPDLADIPLTLKRGWDADTGGAWWPGNRLLDERMEATGMSEQRLGDILAHEIGHALSKRQGWSRGSSPEQEKRPWIGYGYSWPFRGSSDNAMNRYKDVVGEQNSDLDERLHANAPYKKYDTPQSFPSWEMLPPAAATKRRYSLERDITGQRPREMPPSWQYETKPENMRNPGSPAWAQTWGLGKAGAQLGAGAWFAKQLWNSLWPDKTPEQHMREQGKQQPHISIPPSPNLSGVPGAEHGEPGVDEQGMIDAYRPRPDAKSGSW